MRVYLNPGRVQAEVSFLGQMRHENLVRLVGYCAEDEQRLLVYEFMCNGSLENHLFRSKQGHKEVFTDISTLQC